ncbi:MAG TPA: helicase-associated domain-containing protein [Opitutaceae bacterium]|jgi:DNA excision repair protein ERCC-3|nr:helicase-associated domain-containing protein [Opitutaceae bacterium]
MAPKRKAPAQAAAGRKRVQSGVSTPRATESDEPSGSDSFDDPDPEEEQQLNHLVDKFSIPQYSEDFYALDDEVSYLFGEHDYAGIPLKPDHDTRPLWIDPGRGRIIVEAFHPRFKDAESFLINIAEPLSRVQMIHEYTLTAHSLFAAVSVGLTTNDILELLDEFCKTPIPKSIVEFIKGSTLSFGKVRLVLKDTKYWVESQDREVIQTLLRDEIISKLRIDSTGVTTEAAPKMGDLVISGTSATVAPQPARPAAEEEGASENQASAPLITEEMEPEEQVHKFEILPESVQEVSKRCRFIDLPLTEEYDFRNDSENANLVIDLKPAAQIRDYQEKALHKMFSNGRARSGIIVLPCGAGKTLVGITAACTIKKGIIVLCTSAMSVVQWRAEFLKWSNVSADDIATFTADSKSMFRGNTGILISTYSMITQTKNRSYDAQKVMGAIENREWGLMILDEVHVVPAEMFKRVTFKVKAHSKLGLTATLLREDDKIQDLNFLIGPKLYEANWQELSEQGHIAKVQCAEVQCPMTVEFYMEYLTAKTPQRRTLLFTMNPRKFQACQFLINYHEGRGDKIIVFSDNVYALHQYALKMGKALIFGGTPQAERMKILENFQHNDAINTIFLSKIGDTSLDLPEATCLIQISSHYGSRRQEAQRLGRILRAKRRNDEGFNAFFYSLVSKDTDEMFYSWKRQAFLVDQGYAFKIITALNGIKEMTGLAFQTPQERRDLLSDVLLQNETAADSEVIDGDLFSVGGRAGKKKGAVVRRRAGMLADYSGGQRMAYVEFNKSKNKELKGKGNAFMRKMRREEDKRKAANKA